MPSTAELQILINAKDKASGPLGKIQKKFGGFGKAAMIGGGLAAGAILGIGTAAVKTAANFASLESQIAAATGATGENLESLKGSFRDVASSVAIDTESVAGVISELNTRLGLSGESLEVMTTKVAEVSRMLGVDATSATVAMTQAMNRWGVEASKGPEFLDQMFTASQKTGIGFEGLSRMMSEYGSVLKNASYSQEEAIALFGQLHKAGLPVSRIMPALNMATRKFAEEGINLREGLEGAISQIANAKTNVEALGIATEIFGAEGAQRLTDAVRAGDWEISKLTEHLVGATGAVDKFSETTKDPATRFAELKNKLEGVLATLGGKLLPLLEPLIDAIVQLTESLPVDEFGELLHDLLKPLIKMLVELVQVLPIKPMITLVSAALKPLLAILEAIMAILTPIIGAFSKLIGIIAKGLGTVLGPIGNFLAPLGGMISNIMPNFQHGGIVPGPIGAPVPVMAHGGERFLGAGNRQEQVLHLSLYIDGQQITDVVERRMDRRFRIQQPST